ncbi:exodeoxyribonuclease III [Candidatus Ichthyocystis hellenicum]|uniref:exodeoxyribonuclease III n=1 Tax=Candidatus Ichthyocystis hellenicum TaxID=1561003 RepID=UPI000A9D5617|nr:exodeoxyribonuclease III [Candidatus Ichthyocystis hellenicum]
MTTLKIATWNLNSLNVRLPHLLKWLDKHRPDFIGLQELKMQHDNFPVDIFNKEGYDCYWMGQKTFNGVAILSRHSILSTHNVLPELNEEQKRAISIETNHGYFINLYCPNGREKGSASFEYKMMWYAQLSQYLREIIKTQKMCIVCGDFNIAPAEVDIYDHTRFEDTILCTPEEKSCFQDIINIGFIDVFREMNPKERQYSWWDYRGGSFRQNKGARIDHILIDNEHNNCVTGCYIDTEPRKEDRPSDHTPVIMEISI